MSKEKTNSLGGDVPKDLRRKEMLNVQSIHDGKSNTVPSSEAIIESSKCDSGIKGDLNSSDMPKDINRVTNTTASGKAEEPKAGNDAVSSNRGTMGEYLISSRGGAKYEPKMDIYSSLTYKPRKEYRNVLTRMQNELKDGPFSILYRSIYEHLRVCVWTRSFNHVRGVCTGYVVAYDKHFNLAMFDVDEVYRNPLGLLPKSGQKKRKKKKKKSKFETDTNSKNISQSKDIEEAVNQLSIIETEKSKNENKPTDRHSETNKNKKGETTAIKPETKNLKKYLSRLQGEIKELGTSESDDDSETNVDNLEDKLAQLKRELENLSDTGSSVGEDSTSEASETENVSVNDSRNRSPPSKTLDLREKLLRRRASASCHASSQKAGSRNDSNADKRSSSHGRYSKGSKHEPRSAEGQKSTQGRDRSPSAAERTRNMRRHTGSDDTSEKRSSGSTSSPSHRNRCGKDRKFEKTDTHSKKVFGSLKSRSKSRENRPHSTERSSRSDEGQASSRSYSYDSSGLRTGRRKEREVTSRTDKDNRRQNESQPSNKEKKDTQVPSLLDLSFGDRFTDNNVLQRHVNQIFIRGDNVVMVALME